MDKIEKPSDELNHFISRVCISPGHAASFTGLDKLYLLVKNHFSAITIKELRKWVESNLSYSFTNSLEETSTKTRCMLLKFIVNGKLI